MRRITVWNKKENRKISGNAAPMEHNLNEYLRKHPECEVSFGSELCFPVLRARKLDLFRLAG